MERKTDGAENKSIWIFFIYYLFICTISICFFCVFLYMCYYHGVIAAHALQNSLETIGFL